MDATSLKCFAQDYQIMTTFKFIWILNGTHKKILFFLSIL